MPSEKPPNQEYLRAMDAAKEVRFEIADTEKLIAEAKQQIEELKKDRQAASEVNESIRGRELDQAEIAKIDSYIQNAEQGLADFEKMKAELEQMLKDLDRTHQKGKEFGRAKPG